MTIPPGLIHGAVARGMRGLKKLPIATQMAMLTGVSEPTAQAVESFGMGATEPLNIAKGAGQLARKGIEAWHGSPHKFDQFSLDNIGTGEGAQAYGHGLYFAENPEVARAYRPPPKGFKWQGSGTPDREVMRVLPDWEEDVHGRYSLENLVAFLKKKAANISGLDDPDDALAAKRAIEHVESGLLVPKDEGALYRVRLDVEPDELMDWDAPIVKQSPRVRDILKREFGHANASGATGQSVYENAASLADDPEIVSEDLLKNGIPGLRYWDGGSRQANSGTRNYVMFDPSRVKIIERLAAMGLSGAAIKELMQKIRSDQRTQAVAPSQEQR